MIEVIKPGLFTTIQDQGRWGYQADGVGIAGAMDSLALAAGNLLVGNPEGAAGLEMTILGPTLKFHPGNLVCRHRGGFGSPPGWSSPLQLDGPPRSAGFHFKFRGPPERGPRLSRGGRRLQRSGRYGFAVHVSPRPVWGVGGSPAKSAGSDPAGISGPGHQIPGGVCFSCKPSPSVSKKSAAEGCFGAFSGFFFRGRIGRISFRGIPDHAEFRPDGISSSGQGHNPAKDARVDYLRPRQWNDSGSPQRAADHPFGRPPDHRRISRHRHRHPCRSSPCGSMCAGRCGSFCGGVAG